MGDLVSIIIPVYNTEKYLKRCLDSAINQTYKNLEIIIVNDGSTDGSIEIINDYEQKDNRIRVLNIVNSGLSVARNTALNNAHGEYVVFLDSDDWLSLDLVERCINVCIDKKCDLVCFQYYLTYGEISDNSSSNTALDVEIVDSLGALKELNDESRIQSMVCNKFYSKSCFQTIRFPAGKKYEDSFIMYKIFLQCGNIGIIEDRLYYYFQRADSIIHTPAYSNMIDLVDSYIVRYIDTKSLCSSSQRVMMMGNVKKKYILLKRYYKNNSDIDAREKWILDTCQIDSIKNSKLVEFLFEIARHSHYGIRMFYIMAGKDSAIRKVIRQYYLLHK